MTETPEQLAAEFIGAALDGCTRVCCVPRIESRRHEHDATSAEFVMDGHRFRITVEPIPEPTPAERTADLYGPVDQTPNQ